MPRKYRSRRRSAFTLLEIMLVVGLLALLAAFVIPSVINQGETAKKDMARAAIGPSGPMASAIKLFKFNTSKYPGELKDLLEKPGDVDEKKWNGPYIEDKSGLQDPWGAEYKYLSPGQHNEKSYDLWSIGPDGQDGTDDDVTNWTRDNE